MKKDSLIKLARAGYVGLGGFVFFWAFACASPPPYRVVKKTQFDGVLAITNPGDPESRQLIDAEMRNHCRGTYEVVEEGEVVIGTDQITNSSSSTYGQQQSAANVFGGRRWASGNSSTFGSQHSSGQEVQSTRDAKEYQVRYRCTAGAPQPAVMPAPGPAPAPGVAPGVAPRTSQSEIHTLRIRVYE